MENYQLAEKITEKHPLLNSYPYIIAQLLFNRGIKTKEEAEKFLNPQWEDYYDPFLMQDMERAVERIQAAIERGEKITIYADYDADGVPGAVILSDLFKKIGKVNFDIYIPHRQDEGYGIHQTALEKIKESGTQVIVSIDLGITAYQEALWCKEHQIDLIITDHHLPLQNEEKKEKLPEAFAILNPKRKDDQYPDPMLCGAGVIFKFVQAFIKKYGIKYQIYEGWEKWLLDMLAIATISDMVPLRNENRIFSYYGLKVIQKLLKSKGRRQGLQQLLWSLGVQGDYLIEENISFGVSPHINAASRMSHARDALALFLAENDLDAENSVAQVKKLNDARKKLVAKTLQEAEEMLKEKEVEDLIVIGKADWQAGILGLVASKLMEKYQVPVFVWSKENELIKGSCRSLNGIHLVDLMEASPKKTFLHFGGHKLAGGFSCEVQEIEKLETRLKKALKDYQTKHKPKRDRMLIDAELSIDLISENFYHLIQKLAPFGTGNPKPRFLFKKVFVEKINHFGKDKNHLEVFFKNSFGKTIRGISFFKKREDFPRLKEGKYFDFIGEIEYSVFHGKHELRLKIIDFL